MNKLISSVRVILDNSFALFLKQVVCFKKIWKKTNSCGKLTKYCFWTFLLLKLRAWCNGSFAINPSELNTYLSLSIFKHALKSIHSRVQYIQQHFADSSFSNLANENKTKNYESCWGQWLWRHGRVRLWSTRCYGGIRFGNSATAIATARLHFRFIALSFFFLPAALMKDFRLIDKRNIENQTEPRPNLQNAYTP